MILSRFAALPISLTRKASLFSAEYLFWDPSGFFHIANLLASGEPRLIDDARRILDTVAAAQRPSGMLPHHFNGAEPTFVAISGATLPATNLFWLKVICHDIAAIWVAFFSRCQRYRC